MYDGVRIPLDERLQGLLDRLAQVEAARRAMYDEFHLYARYQATKRQSVGSRSPAS